MVGVDVCLREREKNTEFDLGRNMRAGDNIKLTSRQRRGSERDEQSMD